MMRSNHLISPEILYKHLGSKNITVIDGSWHLPGSGRDGYAEYLKQHIPGAVFFDIDTISDHTTGLPHMLPSPEVFAEHASRLGLTVDQPIIVYDSAGLFSAARVWWTLKVMGAQNVRLLDGGLPAWLAAGFETSSTPPKVTPTKFVANFQGAKVINLDQMKAAISQNTATILDARPGPRFEGNAPEPRPDLPSGHMPTAHSLPASSLIDQGRLKPESTLQAAINALDIAPEKQIITTCGSGVTAAIITFALTTLGYDAGGLYDGAWSEWAAQNDTPILPSRTPLSSA